MRQSIIVLSLAIFFSCSRDGIQETSIEASIKVENKGLIRLDLDSNYPSAFDMITMEDGNNAIVGIDRRKNEVLFFDITGKLIMNIKVPTIDQPIGLNRISDIHFINKDSILIYDAQYLKLILQDFESNVIDSWSLPSFWSEVSRGGNVGIVDAFREDGKLMVELLAFQNLYPVYSQEFYAETSLLHLVNLTDETVHSHIGYPKESPYRNELFISAFFPYVVKASDSYVLSFPYDNNLYLYSKDLSTYSYLEDRPTGFPEAKGQSFDAEQTNSDILYSRKLNGFGLFMRNTINIDGVGECVIRVYREALGDKDEIPNDRQSFSTNDYPPIYRLELFRISEGTISKIGKEVSLEDLGISNLVGQDKEGNLIFIENNKEKEDPGFVVVSLKVEY